MSYYSAESLLVRSNRISMYRITVLSLESLFVRSNRISMCRITVLSLESLFVQSNRISVPCITYRCNSIYVNHIYGYLALLHRSI